MTSKRLGEVAFNAAYDYREEADKLLNWSYRDEEEKELWDRAAQGVKAYLEEKCGIGLTYDEEKLGDLVNISPDLTIPPIEPGSKEEWMILNGVAPVRQVTEDEIREMYNPGGYRITNLDKAPSMLIHNTGGVGYGSYTKEDILTTGATINFVCNGLITEIIQVLPGESYIFKDGVFTKQEVRGVLPVPIGGTGEELHPGMQEAIDDYMDIMAQRGMSADDEIALLKTKLEAVTLDRDRLQQELVEIKLDYRSLLGTNWESSYNKRSSDESD